MTRQTLPALAALILLAACSGSDPQPQQMPDNGGEMLDVTNEAMNVQEAPAPTPAPTATPENVTEAAPEVSREEQVQDDADATGMTARVTRDEGENASAPADVSEVKN